jgi:uncharacterized membrane protein (UPF0127 family)
MTSGAWLKTSSKSLTTSIETAKKHRKLLSRVALFLLVVLAGPWRQTSALAQDGPSKPVKLETLEIVTASGVHPFSVEVMRTEEERERGLMFRQFLAEDRGMLFDFKTERVVMMWMKNTYLPLDMIFIARAGKVVSIAENAAPLSEKIISSGVPAFAVLEVTAGTAARIGLRIGDLVRHPIFSRRSSG